MIIYSVDGWSRRANFEHFVEDGDADAWEYAFDVFGRVSQDLMIERCEMLIDAKIAECYEQEVVDERIETYWSIMK